MLQYLTCLFFVLVGGLVFVIILSLIGVATTEYSAVTLSNCNETKDMWYGFMNPGNWIAPSMSCQPSILKPGDGILLMQLRSNVVLITDSSGSLSPSHQIQGFIDPRPNQFNGMSYRNNALNNCSVEYVIGWETISPTVPPYGIMRRYQTQSVEFADNYAGMACNTSADQYLFLTTNLNGFAPLNELALGFMNPNLNLSGPLPIGAAVAMWSEILNDLYSSLPHSDPFCIRVLWPVTFPFWGGSFLLR